MKHFMLWGSSREGMSANGESAKAAYVDGQVMLISRGAVERNALPPGFQRFLTSAECEVEGVTTISVV